MIFLSLVVTLLGTVLPATSSVDPVQVNFGYDRRCRKRRCRVSQLRDFLGREGRKIRRNLETCSVDYFVNCAGHYADKIALDIGFSKEYRY